MLITNEIFSAFLHCETKAYLKSSDKFESKFKPINLKQKLIEGFINSFKENFCLQERNFVIAATNRHIIEDNKSQFLFDCIIQTQDLQSHIPVLERIADPDK
jgi:translation elongation factor EF-Ts